MEIINPKGILKLTNLSKNTTNKIFNHELNQYRNFSSKSKNVHLTIRLKQENLLNTTPCLTNLINLNTGSSIKIKKSFSSLIQSNENLSSQSSNLNSSTNLKRNYINSCKSNIKYDIVSSIIRKNALCKTNKINVIPQTYFHSGPILKDQDDNMPKFRDSKEKKEYIKLATKRNEIASKGRMEGSYHWALSKIVVAGILGCTVVYGIFGHHMFIDVLLGVLLPMHVFYTFQDLVFDYIPSRRYPRANKALIWIIRIITIISLFSMFKFNTEDIGISDAAKQAWNSAKIHKPDEEIKDEDIFYDAK
ncbi:hypothetical protein BCR36DRAFT_346929 [Piromyces finnis]|uniref:Succinate dehydrogenase [ubiquinone] cytochrome b small subunit n=1 Tax=Piromyces finnis TaxID=1754191 RepID=A0A1Y1VHM7_9FUNG|nr:hypothetical protein BCR36DRAFT_346929 [Piromyces finnis]|eukprot:ORX55271.1 hypothetical protein BCR36DRAFT_346929 [Piromyces finnis]